MYIHTYIHIFNVVFFNRLLIFSTILLFIYLKLEGRGELSKIFSGLAKLQIPNICILNIYEISSFSAVENYTWQLMKKIH